MTSRKEIVDLLSRAAKSPVRDRSLAGMVRKSLELVLDLRSDDVSWADLAELFAEAGKPVTDEVLRRTVRRALRSSTSTGAKPSGDPNKAFSKLAHLGVQAPPVVLNAEGREATGPPAQIDQATQSPVPMGGASGMQRARDNTERLKKLKETL